MVTGKKSEIPLKSKKVLKKKKILVPIGSRGNVSFLIFMRVVRGLGTRYFPQKIPEFFFHITTKEHFRHT